MTKVIFSSLVLSSSLICADMTLEELKQENEKLQLQLKNAQMKQQLKEMENTTPPPDKGVKPATQEQPQTPQKSQDNLAQKEAPKQEKEENPQSQEEAQPTKDEYRKGLLWGIGFGGTFSSYQTPIFTKKVGTSILSEIREEPLFPYAFQSQLGQTIMFNRYFGFQHYANLEVDFGSNDYWKITSIDITYNLDLLANLINVDAFGLGVILGVGAGFKKTFFSLAGDDKDTSLFEGQAKINAGIRWIFGSRFALDFIFRIPLLETHTGYYYYNASNEQEFLKYKDYFSFAVNFTLGRF